MSDWLQQLTNEERRRDEEEIRQDWINWTAKESPYWMWLEWKEIGNDTTRNS